MDRRARRGLVSFWVLLAACSSGPDPTPSIAAEPVTPLVETVEAPVDVTPAPPAPPAEALAEPLEVSVEVFSIAPAPAEADEDDERWDDDDVGDVDFEMRDIVDDELFARGFSIPDFELEGPADATLGSAIHGVMVEHAVDARDSEVGGECRVTLATPHLVSAICTIEGDAGRTSFDYGLFALAYRIEGAEVTAAPVRSSLLANTDLSALANAACVQALLEDDEEADVGEGGPCGGYRAIAYGPRGFVVRSASWERATVEATIPYDAPELAGRFLAGGPLEAILTASERSTVTIPAAESIAIDLANDCHITWTWGAPTEIDPAMAAFDAAAPNESTLWRDATGLRPAHDGCAHTAAEVTVEEERAHALAGDAAVYRVPPFRTVGLVRLVTTETLNLRESPGTDGRLLGTFSVGTRLVGVEGWLDHESRRGSRGSWTRVWAADGVVGWVGGRYVTPATDLCPRPVLTARGAVPEDAFGAAAPHALLGVSGGVHFAILEAGARSWILVSSDCAFGTIDRTLEVEGHVEEVRWISGRGTDPPIALVGTSAVRPADPGFDGTMRWSLFAPGATTAGWSTEARSHPGLPDAAREDVDTSVRAAGATWDVAITPPGGRARRARWDGTAFVESPASR